MAQKTPHKITRAEIREKFVGEEYPIHLIGRHIEITEAMKNYVLEKLTKIEKFGTRILDVLIVMDYQRGIHMIDILITLNNKKILVSGREKDMYASIDQSIKHLKSKLSRYHRYLHELDRTKIGYVVHPGETGISSLEEINDQIEEETLHKIEEELAPHPISKREKKALKQLNEREALLTMESSAETCLMYLGEEDAKIKVIYRQHDGSYGILEPE